ncbi:hypothetical protein J6590_091466 [Homalodisca vitripennis]|nr:hypothetical protein J6590_091466 [Homalodisca vitripennis]
MAICKFWDVSGTDRHSGWRTLTYSLNHCTGRGFVWVTSDEINFVGCYFTTNEGMSNFEGKLDNMEGRLFAFSEQT